MLAEVTALFGEALKVTVSFGLAVEITIARSQIAGCCQRDLPRPALSGMRREKTPDLQCLLISMA